MSGVRTSLACALLSSLFALLAVPTNGQTLPPGFSPTTVASGLLNPTAMAFAPDGRLFVCQQGGQLRVIEAGILLSTPFLTVNVDASGERGLLGVAFDPFFVSNHYVYIYYTVPGPAPGAPAHNRVSQFTASGNVAVGNEVILVELENLSLTASNHNGGALGFGPDQKLYIAVGDNANSANSQTLGNRLGKILRINSDGTIPNDNPFVNTLNANPAIWALGLRNPFSFAFQPGTGRMFINDVGESTFEEINEGVTGANYGWRSCEGPCSPPNPNFRDPVYYYQHPPNSTTQGCAITSGVFYNPSTVQFPSSYVGKYFFVDLCGNWMNYIEPSNPPVVNQATVFAMGLVGNPVAVVVGPDGSLYYLSRGNGGQVSRISYPGDTPGGAVNGGPQSNGWFDVANCTTIAGWAWDPAQPNSPVNVDILANSVVIATIPADQFRQDLLNAGKGNGVHGFSFTVPQSLKNGQIQSIRIRVTGSNVELFNSPRSITCGTPSGGGGAVNGGPQSNGWFDGADCTTLFGWAWDPAQPNSPVNIDILANGVVIATIPADQFRQDLLNAGVGNGVHGSSFTVPQSLKNGQIQSIRIRVTGSNVELSNSPRSITCPSP